MATSTQRRHPIDGRPGLSNASMCTTPPPIIFLLVTLLMTISATVMMCVAVMTDHWETITWDREYLIKLTNNTPHALHWHLSDRVARLPITRTSEHKSNSMNSILKKKNPKNSSPQVMANERISFWCRCTVAFGHCALIWMSTRCINWVVLDFRTPQNASTIWPKMQSTVATKTNTIWHTMNTRRIQCPDDHPSVSINFHPHRHRHRVIVFDFFSAGMQNLSISCSLVCLIILGSAALLGSFGIFQRQISAILVTGVMYLLAGESQTQMQSNRFLNNSSHPPPSSYLTQLYSPCSHWWLCISNGTMDEPISMAPSKVSFRRKATVALPSICSSPAYLIHRGVWIWDGAAWSYVPSPTYYG